ncbi:hypothetical protein ARMSODRAFT_1089807 [Armillaria solidipes]|uniref:Uncharacterized protein n=1 Tax=Armillaria solidipes TaxID=1076256 RepID=A0A2H3B5L6_9AGAR|nr:hypothetical protein ARMSODRAFT_1089807 [Armillaria solidipes]
MAWLNGDSQWKPCSGGCTCPDHDLPLYTSTFSDNMLENRDLVRLARSNEEPLPAEAAVLTGMIAEYSERITALDSRVVDLRELRTTLLRQISLIDEEANHILGEREKLSVAIDTRKKFLSPVRRLPPEILCRIFHETVNKTIPRSLSKRERGWWDFQDVTSPLWTIELVCRRWREAVISFPELWSYLNVVVTDDNFFMGTYRYTRLLSRQLARSKQHFLTVSIHHDAEESGSHELPEALIALLFSASERIQVLSLAMSSTTFSSLQPLRLFFPSLEYLWLLSTDSPDTNELGGTVLFDGAPKLWSVNVMDIQYPSWSFSLPWNQITYFASDHACLHGADAFPLQIMDQLRSMPNVEECHLRCEAWDENLITEQPQVICRKLRSLNLSTRLTHQRPTFQILNQLTTPALSSLSFDGCVYDKELDVENTFTAIRNLIGRSDNPLKTLRFLHGLVLTEDILSILCSTPTLENIGLEKVLLEAFTRSFFDRLTIKPTAPPSDAAILLPRLRLFHLSGVMSKDFDAEGFVGMIESRCQQVNPAVARLDSVLLHRFVPPEEPDDDVAQTLSRLDNLHSTGVGIAIFKRAMLPSEKSVW